MALPKLIKVEDLMEFAKLVSGKYFYILKKYSDKEYLIQIDEDTSTHYDFTISDEDKERVLFKILGDINSNKKYKASLITASLKAGDEEEDIEDVLLIYEPEYFVKEFENLIKNNLELQEESKKIEDLFNKLRSILAKGTALPEFQSEEIKQKRESIIEFEKAEDKPIDQKQFNVFEELYKEADIQKRLKRVKLYETKKKVEEKEEEYGLKDEDDNEGGDDE